MASQADKLSPIFKSLRPNEAPLASVATAAGKDAEQRWPLFRAIAPVKPSAAPSLTEEEKTNRASSKTTAGSQRAPALSMPGLNEQLAQGLSKMVGRKPSSRAGSRAQSKSSARSAAPVSVEPNPQAEAAPILLAKAPLEPAPISRPSPKAPTQVAPDLPPPVRLPIAPRLPPEPIAQAVPMLQTRSTPPSEPAEPPAKLTLAKVAPKLSAAPASASVSAQVLISAPVAPAAKISMAKATVVQEAQRSTESLKSLFGRLQAPKKPESQTSSVKKSSFLGRLARR